jgi:hypothetical protein
MPSPSAKASFYSAAAHVIACAGLFGSLAASFGHSREAGVAGFIATALVSLPLAYKVDRLKNTPR